MSITVSRSFLAFILTLGVLLGTWLSPSDLFGEVDAAPSDIHGSPNIAVASYKTEAGLFVLYTDGTIQKATDGTNLGNQYENAPDVSAPNNQRGYPGGSPNVAVDVVPHSKGTFVLFADGSIRKHRNAEASAPPATPRFERGFWNGFELFAHTRGTRVTGGGGTYTIYFDPPFEDYPSIQMTPVEGGLVGYVTYRPGQQPPISQVNVSFRNTAGGLNPSGFLFTASGH